MIKVSFIGSGRMASAIVTGILRNKCYTPDEVACTGGNDDTATILSKKTGISVFDSEKIPELTSILILACKPQQLEQLSDTLATQSEGKIIISILAGTNLEKLKIKYPNAKVIVRSMPNTPGQIGKGITAYVPSEPLSSNDQKIVENILGSLGKTLSVPEEKMDQVTALSGSGPAYIFEFTAGLIESGIKLGLSQDEAELLAKETVYGAACLMNQSLDKPDELRNQVTSPGGTTEAALGVFKKEGLRTIICEALTAANNRSIELR